MKSVDLTWFLFHANFFICTHLKVELTFQNLIAHYARKSKRVTIPSEDRPGERCELNEHSSIK